MAEITELTDEQAVALIQKINDETTEKGNKKTEVASLLNYLRNKVGGDFIPLSGTEEGKPITGNVEIEDTNINYSTIEISRKSGGSASTGLKWLDDNMLIVGANENTSSSGGKILLGNDATLIYEYGTTELSQQVSLRLEPGIINVYSNNESFAGIKGNNDYTEISSGDIETDKLIYAQRSYVDKANSYSTEEIATGGTWIDGKPIYRKTKVFSGSELTNDGYINLIADFPEIENICTPPHFITDWKTDNGVMSFTRNVNTYYQYTIENNNENDGYAVRAVSNTFHATNMDLTPLTSITLTLEYTKTTD